jgi:uroporphyrin-III C-methyltransferase/uroporphyrinogen III methyltransferase/synthase
MTVHLVGAGPGDPELLTVRAVALLRRAEVVVTDRPSSDPIADLAPPDAERILVGKRPGAPALGQDELDALLVELGRSGREVVRLKSGDPFVAARGGEEALALAAAGVPFTVVPGVSAGLAAPAFAGIPVHVRQRSRVVTILAGNTDPEYPGEVDWDALARLGGTIVVLTGRSRIRRIAGWLLAAGLSPDTPVAAISAASRAGEQRTVRGTLSALPPRLDPPVTFVIGEVAAIDLDWFAGGEASTVAQTGSVTPLAPRDPAPARPDPRASGSHDAPAATPSRPRGAGAGMPRSATLPSSTPEGPRAHP